MNGTIRLGLPWLVLLLPGCFLAGPDSLDWTGAADDDTVADDDTGDDDTGPDDDDVDDDDTGDDDTDDDDTGPDADGDGWTTPEDCDDGDARVYPGATEIWDFQVNDCEADTGGPEVLEARTLASGVEPGAIIHTGEWEFFGNSYSLGDLDGDGDTDLCARVESLDNGDVLVFLGIDGVLSSGAIVSTMDADVIVSPATAALGDVDCSRDLDLDGDTEMVLSSVNDSSEDNGGGGIHVFDGGPGFAAGAMLGADEALASDWASTGYTGRCFGIGQLDSDPELEIAYAALSDWRLGTEEPVLLVTDGTLTPEGVIPISHLAEWTPGCFVVEDLSGDGTSEVFIVDSGGPRLILGERASGTAPRVWAAGYDIASVWVDSAYAADVTGDGLPELLLGDTGWDDEEEEQQEGAVAIVFGRAGAVGWESGLAPGGELSPERAILIEGPDPHGMMGSMICPLGDASGDGIGDFSVGAPGWWEEGGQGLVFEGRTEDDWKAEADGEGHITAGSESSRFVGFMDEGTGNLGRSHGNCGNTWDSLDPEIPRIWWKASSWDEEGELLHWSLQVDAGR